jgi:hypothetical protein
MSPRPQIYYRISRQNELDQKQSALNSNHNHVRFTGPSAGGSRLVMTVITFSASLIVGMGFAAASRPAALLDASVQAPPSPPAFQPPPRHFGPAVVTDEGDAGIASFAPAMAIGVGVTGALARRRRAMLTSAA